MQGTNFQESWQGSGGRLVLSFFLVRGWCVGLVRLVGAFDWCVGLVRLLLRVVASFL